MIYDLHSHSTASDGVLTPTELVARAVAQNVNVLALTDHDTLSGVAEAKKTAQCHAIDLISGVEISVLWQEKVFHLAALNIDEQNGDLLALLELQLRNREIRAREIAEKLAKLGIPNAYEGARSFAKGEVTRAHYGRFLVAEGYVKNDEQAFKRYLSQGKPAYVKANWCSIEEAVNATHAAGGLICVAHPLRYKLTASWMKKMIRVFKDAGGDGIEVAGCGQTPDQRQLLARWANEFELLASAGSDFHYPTGWIELGKNLQLPQNVKPVWEQF